MSGAVETTIRTRVPLPCIPVIGHAAMIVVWLLVVYTVQSCLVCPKTAQAGRLTFDQLVRSRPQSPHPAVVRVIVPEHGAVSHGSGTLIDVHGDYGLVVTNWHVVRDSVGDIVVVFPNGFRSAGRVLKVDQDWDLAALAIWRPPATPMAMASAAPRPGDVLTIAGYGQGPYRAATGRCTQYVAPGADLPYEMVEVSASARQGDSGGPIMNQKGELAGVLFGSTRNVTSGSYVGRVRWFLASISQHLRTYSGAVAQSVPQHATAPSRSTSRSRATTTAQVTAAIGATDSARAEDLVPVAESSGAAADQRTDQRADHRVALHQKTGSERPIPFPEKPQLASQPSSPKSRTAEAYTGHEEIGWALLAGDSAWEQVKSVFAIMGVLAVIHRLTRRNTAS